MRGTSSVGVGVPSTLFLGSINGRTSSVTAAAFVDCRFFLAGAGVGTGGSTLRSPADERPGPGFDRRLPTDVDGTGSTGGEALRVFMRFKGGGGVGGIVLVDADLIGVAGCPLLRNARATLCARTACSVWLAMGGGTTGWSGVVSIGSYVNSASSSDAGITSDEGERR